MSHETAEIIFDQIGKSRLHGAYTLTGGRKLAFGPDVPLKQIEVDEAGCIDIVNGLMWQPNVSRRNVKFIIVLQPCDTYTIWLWRGYTTQEFIKKNDGKIGEVLEQMDDVYCDQLIDVIDSMYVDYIKKYQEGFIKI